MSTTEIHRRKYSRNVTIHKTTTTTNNVTPKTGPKATVIVNNLIMPDSHREEQQYTRAPTLPPTKHPTSPPTQPPTDYPIEWPDANDRRSNIEMEHRVKINS